jgi:fidgetin-like protein 1
MEESFFKLQEILEELGGSLEGREDASLYRDILYAHFIEETREKKENIPFVHEYKCSRAIPLSEIEEIVSPKKTSMQGSRETPRSSPAVSSASPAGTSGLVRFLAQSKNRGNKQEGRDDRAREENPFKTAAEMAGIEKKEEKKKEKRAEEIDPESNLEPRLMEMIRNEVATLDEPVSWDDIAGLSSTKKAIREVVIWPLLRPDIFKGLRGPPKGLLLFGPPGTGKTLIGRCIASQSNSTFYSISASSLTSKWVGEGEKMVRALFYVAKSSSPSVVFIDEIDSLLMQRTEGENEGTRRIKTEFLVQMDGVKGSSGVLVIGATNRPKEIDEAARRRFVKRLYVPLPDREGRGVMIRKLLQDEAELGDEEVERMAGETEGYSGSDLFNLCREAAMEPVREAGCIESLGLAEGCSLRKICLGDLVKGMFQIRKSVSEEEVKSYEEWNKKFGSS